MQCKTRTVSEKIAQKIREDVGGYFFFNFLYLAILQQDNLTINLNEVLLLDNQSLRSISKEDQTSVAFEQHCAFIFNTKTHDESKSK